VTRRAVRAADFFFDRLSLLLPDERTSTGTPSIADFLAYEMPPIQERLSEDLERYTVRHRDEPSVRMFFGRGVFVPAITLYVTLDDDGAVWLLDLDLELGF
jgi:hypothetical protein